MNDVLCTDLPQDSEYDKLSHRIVRLFGELEDTEPTELPPLNDSVHIKAVERLIKHADDETHVRFEYCERPVRVYGDERIEILASSNPR